MKMAFIRVKNRKFKEKDFDYAYLVENKRGRFGPRQRVIRYLGRIYKFEKIKDFEFEIKEDSYKDSLISLYINELKRHGFRKRGGVFYRKNCFADLEGLNVFDKNGKKSVLQVNAGFICDYSLKELFNLKFEDKEEFKKEFAKKLVLSGLDVKPEVFVGLYSLIKS